MQYGSPKMFMKKSDSERALVTQDRYRVPTFKFLEEISAVVIITSGEATQVNGSGIAGKVELESYDLGVK